MKLESLMIQQSGNSAGLRPFDFAQGRPWQDSRGGYLYMGSASVLPDQVYDAF